MGIDPLYADFLAQSKECGARLDALQINSCPTVKHIDCSIKPHRFNHIVRFLLRMIDRMKRDDIMPDKWLQKVASGHGDYTSATREYARNLIEAEGALQAALVLFEPSHIFELEAENAVLRQKIELYEKNHSRHI